MLHTKRVTRMELYAVILQEVERHRFRSLNEDERAENDLEGSGLVFQGKARPG